MRDSERLRQVRELVREKHSVSVKELARMLYVSETTVRRDLRILEKEKSVARVHGGAVTGPMLKSEMFPHRARQMDMPEAKEAIAEQAVQMVHRGDTVFVDGSTTCEFIARRLPADLGLRVVTTGLKAAEVLADRGIDTVISGGIVREDLGDMIGYHNELLIRSMRADILFCSARGLTLDGCFCTSSTEGAVSSTLLIENARRVVMCVTSGKIGRNYPLVFARAEDVDEVLCDEPLPPCLRERVGLNRKRPSAADDRY